MKIILKLLRWWHKRRAHTHALYALSYPPKHDHGWPEGKYEKIDHIRRAEHQLWADYHLAEMSTLSVKLAANKQ